MVNGNYIVYGDRPSSESEIVDDHVHIPQPSEPSTKVKSKRKSNRTANELQNSLHTAQLDNETDSIKYEKKAKEPQLLRYATTTDEESYGVENYETYDMKPASEPPRRYAFIKKPRNPADGSTNYQYSRSSSSSPSGQLPTISEHGEQHGTYRARAPAPPSPNNNHYTHDYDHKLEKYFAKPKPVKKFAAKGSHPDSLYRVPASSATGTDKMMKVARVLRWPVALFTVCVALACFVYFLMPDHTGTEIDSVNSTYWDETVLPSAHTHRGADKTSIQTPTTISRATERNAHGGKTPEIDFYDPITETSSKSPSTRKLPVPPVFPSHITPEVQYGNEKADADGHRSPKYVESTNSVQGDSTLKPHITQKPEKPLEIYFKNGGVLPYVPDNNSQTDAPGGTTEDKLLIKVEDEAPVKNYKSVYRVLSAPDREQYRPYDTTSQIVHTTKAHPSEAARHDDVVFTSGHSKVFGIGMEDAVTMQSTTPSSTYNTRVSPTLPTWREGDSTTKNSVNSYIDVPHCRSTRLPMCRGVLPYDLAAPAITINKIKILTLLPQIEYLASTNCSTRVKQFACALLEPECHPPPYPPRLPCNNLCRAISDNCDDEIPNELAGLFNCQLYPNIDCEAARGPCYPREMTCGDGTCVSRDWICDGTKDCPGGEDEANCSQCDQSEFRCGTGLCIQKRWLCDGYVDCPGEEDEHQESCQSGFLSRAGSKGDARNGAEGNRGVISEQGEELAGSSPALAVRRPYAERQRSDDVHATGESDSKELLMTSESSSALKSNFSRRPSLSRLMPYSHATLHKPNMQPKFEDDTDKKEASPLKSLTEYNSKSNKKSRYGKDKATDDDKNKVGEINIDDLGIFDETEKANKDTQDKNNAQMSAQPLRARTSVPASLSMPTRYDKSMKKFERYINGADLLKKAAEEDSKHKVEVAEDSIEGSFNTTEGKPAVSGSDSRDFGTAHASPCPSGELRCVDGRCITLAQLCDGTIDCTDHADEDNCYT